MLFEVRNCSAISRVVVVVVLFTIVTPHAGKLRILRRLAYISRNRFTISDDLLVLKLD
jgi:hypothetical protein